MKTEQEKRDKFLAELKGSRSRLNRRAASALKMAYLKIDKLEDAAAHSDKGAEEKASILKEGHVYGYGEIHNQFKVLALYEDYAWVEWQQNGHEVETLYLDNQVIKNIIFFK